MYYIARLISRGAEHITAGALSAVGVVHEVTKAIDWIVFETASLACGALNCHL